jgi:hypothetical protein
MADILGTSTFDMALELIPSKIGRVPVSDVLHRDPRVVQGGSAELSMAQAGTAGLGWFKVHVCKHVTVGDAIVCRLLFPFWPSAEQRYHVRSIVL